MFDSSKAKKSALLLPLLAMGVVLLPSCEPASLPSESKASQGEAKKSFEASLAETAKEGFELEVKTGVYKSLDARGEEADVVSFSGAKAVAQFSGSDLHALSASLLAPISYNGRRRNLAATLVDEMLYFSLENPDNEKTRLAYKASIKREDALDKQGKPIVDDPTGGILSYEYGKLDWVISDILECLSTGASSTPNGASSASPIPFGKILSAWEGAQQKTLPNGDNYFVLTFGEEGSSYSLGLRGDKDFRWSGVDFPAKDANEGQGFQRLGAAKPGQEGAFLQLSLAIRKSETAPRFAVKDPQSYPELFDSLGLFKKFASAIGKQRFGVELSLALAHHEDAVTAETKVNREEVNESLSLAGEAYLDLGGNKINAMAGKLRIEDGKNSGQKKSVSLYGGTASSPYQGRYFLNVNDILKAKTSKTVLDAMAANLSAVSSLETSPALQGLLSFGGYVSDGIKAIKDSPLLAGVGAGSYGSLLDIFDSLQCKDNSIIATLDLKPVGLQGKATLTMNDVSSAGPIAVIELGEGVSFLQADSARSLTLSGAIRLYPYSQSNEIALSGEEMECYAPLTHLESFSEQIGKFAGSSKLRLGFQGSVLYEGKREVNYGDSLQGFEVSGSFGLDWRAAKGAGAARFVDRKEQYRNDHSLKIDVEGPEKEGGADAEATIASANSMIFEYSSVNANVRPTAKLNDYDKGYTVLDEAGVVRTQPHNANQPIKGAFKIYSLNQIFALAKGILARDDSRLGKFFAGATSLEGASLLASLQANAFAPLLAKGILSYASITPEKGVFRLAPWVLGSHGDVLIEVLYEKPAQVEREDGSQETIGGGIRSLRLQLKLESKSIDPETEQEKTQITDIDFTLTIDKILSSEEELPWNFKGIDKSKLTDYSSLYELFEHLSGSAFLGVTSSNKVSTYRLSGKANISFSFISLGMAEFDVYIRLEGSEVCFYMELKVPIRHEFFTGYGNYPSTKLSGYWEERLYGHISGKKSTNYIYLTRNNGRYSDAALAKSEDFLSDAKSFILQGVLGLNRKTMGMINDSGKQEQTAALHGEDLITSYAYEASATAPKWKIGLAPNSLMHKSVIDPFVATISGKKLADGQKSLYAISGSTKVAGVLSLSFDTSLANIASGRYAEAWSGKASDAYNRGFYDQANKAFRLDTKTAVSSWSQSW